MHHSVCSRAGHVVQGIDGPVPHFIPEATSVGQCVKLLALFSASHACRPESIIAI